MNSLRVARAATRIRAPPARLIPQRRGYAEAVSDKIKLTLALPHQVLTPPMNTFVIAIANMKVTEHLQIHRRVSLMLIEQLTASRESLSNRHTGSK